jgi:hypothetical protein
VGSEEVQAVTLISDKENKNRGATKMAARLPDFGDLLWEKRRGVV